MRKRITILGIEIDAVTMEEAVEEFRRLVARKTPSLACSLHVDLCMKIQRDPELRAIYKGADLVLVDGTPMMWAARFLGTPLPERVSGSEFLLAFCLTAAREGHRIFLLGAAPEIARRAKDWLEGHYPGLAIAGTYSPPLGFERDPGENAHIVRIVRQAKPDVLFAALGPSKQEKWLARFHDELEVPVSMGIGSSFDYLAGRLKRAPVWLQQMGLEWSYRLMQEPRRLWRRYLLDDPPFVFHVIKQRLQGTTVYGPDGERSRS